MRHLVGLQAQEPQEPYVGLWTRLTGFVPGDLITLLESRAAVRASTLLRGTLHLVTAADCLGCAPCTAGGPGGGGASARPGRRRPGRAGRGGPATFRVRTEHPARGRPAVGARWPDRGPGPRRRAELAGGTGPGAAARPVGPPGPAATHDRAVARPATGTVVTGRRAGPALPDRFGPATLRPPILVRLTGLRPIQRLRPSCARSATPAAANSSTSPTPRSPTRRCRPRPGSCRRRQHLPVAPGPQPDRGSTQQRGSVPEGLRVGGRLHSRHVEGPLATKRPRHCSVQLVEPIAGARTAPRSAKRANACCASSTRDASKHRVTIG